MEQKIIIWEIIKPIFISVLTAIVTVRFSLRRFRTEKWWEKKAETYSKVIDALHHLKNYCEQKLGVEYGESRLPPEKESELREQYKKASAELTRAIDIGSFIVSKEAVRILEIYQNRPELNWDENPLCDIIEHDLKYVKECLHNFKLAAKKDLRIK